MSRWMLRRQTMETSVVFPKCKFRMSVLCLRISGHSSNDASVIIIVRKEKRIEDLHFAFPANMNRTELIQIIRRKSDWEKRGNESLFCAEEGSRVYQWHFFNAPSRYILLLLLLFPLLTCCACQWLNYWPIVHWHLRTWNAPDISLLINYLVTNSTFPPLFPLG